MRVSHRVVRGKQHREEKGVCGLMLSFAVRSKIGAFNP
jgi:hypothetical protein